MWAWSPGFKKWWPWCLNVNSVSASQLQRTCGAISDACWHLLCLGLSTSPNLNRYPFNWQCPISSPVISLSWFLLNLNNSPALLAEGHWRNNPHVSFSSSPWSLAWLTDQLFHFHQSPCVLAPIPVESCFVLPVSLGSDGSPRLI